MSRTSGEKYAEPMYVVDRVKQGGDLQFLSAV